LGALAALGVFIVASMFIGWLANRAVEGGSFMKGFFLGNRGLGAWALALTATVQSGGTFMGFPSLVYTHGWIVALWIGSYMVVPITGFGIIGKRIAQISRQTGAITVPDLFRARFNSPTVGLVASLFIMFYMTFMMIAQFKAGALVMKLSIPGAGTLALAEEGSIDTAYYIGLAVFALTVVGYTLLGGFLAAVWTDLFQSIMMFFGVVFLLFLALRAAGGLEYATRHSVEELNRISAEKTVEAEIKDGKLAPGDADRRVAELNAPDVRKPGDAYMTGPGYVKDPQQRFMPLGLAVSFFFIWVWAGFGSPAGIVRIMASRSTQTIRRSIYLLAVYNLFIYLPLIVICICGRSMAPDLAKSDEIIPRLALGLTHGLPGGSFLGGLILAAPFGAVMATVSSYLVVISSGLVRDVYQRFLRPDAGHGELRWISYAAMIGVGVISVAAVINPPQYLQAVVVLSGTGAGATFCIPALMTCYWRRATAAGVLAAMFSGAGIFVTLYVIGFLGIGEQHIHLAGLHPYYLFELDPLLWGLSASLVAGIAVSLMSQPPPTELVSRLFDAAPVEAGSVAERATVMS
jgi:SSS family solute:Na+ symporter/sodium/pantothenate symporter